MANYYSTKRSITKKKKIVEDLGGCQICGYGLNVGDNLAALCFHHLNPETKTALPSVILNSRKDISEVLDETILVCQNCHYEIFHPKKEKPRSRSSQIILSNYITILEKKENSCSKCKKHLNVLSSFDLHHTGEKSFCPSDKVRVYHYNEKVRKEIDKCTLLCRNCHFAEHNPRLKMAKLDSYLQFMEEEIQRGTREKNPLNNFSDAELREVYNKYGAMRKLFRELGVKGTTGYEHLKRRGIKQGRDSRSSSSVE